MEHVRRATLARNRKTRKYRRGRSSSRPSRGRPERRQDPRLNATRVLKMGDEELPPDSWVVAVSPVDLEDGRRLMWEAPQPVTFNLVQAKRLQRRAVRTRRNIMGNLVARRDGTYMPLNSSRAIDCLADLAAATWFSFTAIESLANHAIEMLDDDVVIERRGRAIAKQDLVRELGIDDKLKRVVPMVKGGVSISGTRAWEKYRNLKSLRDELLHVKRRGYDPDPSERTAYDRLMVGDADSCADDALAVIDAAWPGWIPEHVRAELSRD